jgi:pimeloyl-ACP methyl ester carboxylesterase
MKTAASPLPETEASAALPAPRGPSLVPAAPSDLARRAGDAALGLAWRLMHARSRDAFVTAIGPVALPRVHYSSDDGWRAPLFVVPALPSALAAGIGAGEPVLLAHGLGGSWRDFSLEAARSLAGTLSALGCNVYLMCHRGDRDALPPEGAAPFSVDDIAVRDLGAAIDAARAHSGFERVLLLGHALGAQAAYVRLALAGDAGIAGLVALCGAVRFRAPASAARNAALVSALLPSGWVLPTRRAAQLGAAFVGGGEDVGAPDTDGPVARARMRYASGDLHGGVVKQVARWVATGHLTDATGRLDVLAALRPLPALIVAAAEDTTCPPSDAEDAAQALAGHFHVVPGGHLDPLTGRSAPEALHGALVAFLERHRRACWGQ